MTSQIDTAEATIGFPEVAAEEKTDEQIKQEYADNIAKKHSKADLVKRVLDTTSLNLELLSLLKVLTSDGSSSAIRAEARSHARDLIRSLDETFTE